MGICKGESDLLIEADQPKLSSSNARLVRQSVEDILGIPARIDNPSMRGYEVIIHHLDASCGTTWRIEGSQRGICWKSPDRHEVTCTDDRDYRTHAMLMNPKMCHRKMERWFKWPGNLHFASPIA